MRKLMLSLAGFRSAFGVMSAYRDVATVVTGSMGVPGRDIKSLFDLVQGLNQFCCTSRKKLVFVEFCLRKMYSNEQTSSICVSLKKTMEELLVEYQKNVQPPFEKVGDSSQSQVSQISEFDDDVDSSASVALLNEFKRYKIAIGREKDKSKLEKYLSLNEPDATNSDDFDVLIWWKLNSHKYPTLALLARDVLAIPLSTVASKSAFSISGRVLDAYRSSLMPKMVQAFIYAQD
ncbi:HAT [Theobroma cacao]|nr:HAT [Theobroma cacao]